MANKREGPQRQTKGSIDAAAAVPLSALRQLLHKTYYTLRAYATNKAGTGYGEERSFLTGEIIFGSVDDFEGNTYITISMGTRHDGEK